MAKKSRLKRAKERWVKIGTEGQRTLSKKPKKRMDAVTMSGEHKPKGLREQIQELRLAVKMLEEISQLRVSTRKD